jgi:cephalosporin-C deacetylase-like acetyl esterase
MMNRRQFVMQTGAILTSPSLQGARGKAEPESLNESALPYSARLPDMLVSDLTRRLNNLAGIWERKRALIETGADVQARNAFVREKFLEMLRHFPKRTALDPITVKATDRDGYRVENVMFQSLPDFWVTGNLYIPATGKGPFPGIISPCGHSLLGRMSPQYQAAYLNLVKGGFVVLSYDPIGQGERRQYWNPQTDVTEVEADPIYEHSMPGQLLLLLGANLTQYLLWEGMRAIDYLLTRPEVDAKRVGCAGHSGGGNMTKFISVMDERVQCAAIIEGGTANRWTVSIAPWQPFGPSDVEQNLFPSAVYGIDQVDLHVAIAPRPLLVGIENYSPAFNQAADAIQTRYRQLGVPEKFTTVAADDPHAWTMKLRLATTNWFSRWFYGREGPLREPQFEIESPQDLYCTPNGSIRYSMQGRTIFSLILEKQASLPPERRVPGTPAELAAWQEEIRTQIGHLLHYRKSDQPLNPRHVVTTPREGYRIDKIEFLAEEGIYIPAWVFVPENGPGIMPVVLYVSDAGIEAEGMEFGKAGRGVLEALTRNGNLVIAVDVRGIGGTRPRHDPELSGSSEFRQLFNVETAMSYMAWFMDQSLFAMRVQDVVRSVDYVMTRNDADYRHLHVIGKGTGGLWCLYAAALDARIRSLICVRSLLSYRSLAGGDRYSYGADVFVPDVLMHFDLPQVAAAMAGRPLALICPADGMKNTVNASQAREAFRWTYRVYESAGAGTCLQIESNGSDIETPEHYLNLISNLTSLSN